MRPEIKINETDNEVVIRITKKADKPLLADAKVDDLVKDDSCYTIAEYMKKHYKELQ